MGSYGLLQYIINLGLFGINLLLLVFLLLFPFVAMILFVLFECNCI